MSGTITPAQLRALRVIMNWTRARMAAQLRIHPRTLRRYEAGESEIDLSIDLTELVGFVGQIAQQGVVAATRGMPVMRGKAAPLEPLGPHLRQKREAVWRR